MVTHPKSHFNISISVFADTELISVPVLAIQGVKTADGKVSHSILKTDMGVTTRLGTNRYYPSYASW